MDKSSGLNFGQALEMLKLGRRVARQHWNIKGDRLVFVALSKGAIDGSLVIENPAIEDPPLVVEGISIRLFDLWDGRIVTRLPHLSLSTTPASSTMTGWAPSQADLLAEDWELLLD